MSPPRPILVWTAPRSISTAFERALMQHPKTSVHHEPFTEPWYFGPRRESSRYADRPPRPGATWANVSRKILADPAQAVIAKVMAYCAVDQLAEIPLERFAHAALIRHPARTVPSLWTASNDTALTGWRGFDEREVGLDALRRALDAAERATGCPPVILDADDMLSDPEGALRAWCEAVGLDWTPAMLTWRPGPVPEWDLWPGWHDAALKSDGLRQRDRKPLPELPPALAPIVARALPAYEAMYARRLRV